MNKLVPNFRPSTRPRSMGMSESGSGLGSGSGPSKELMITLFVFLVIVLIVVLWGTCSESGKAAFRNLKQKAGFKGDLGTYSSAGNSKVDIKSLDIIMFVNPSCPWCQKMLNVLKDSGKLNDLMIVDMNTEEGTELAKKIGAFGKPVPSFISKTNQSGTYGFRESLAELVSALQPSESSGSPQESIADLDIVLIKKEGCGWCKKALEHCSEVGVLGMIKIADINSPEGQEVAKMLPTEDAAYPSWISLKTKKYVIGFKPFDQIVQSLV
jgi:thiol-disulfide isomerase/thioredoxin